LAPKNPLRLPQALSVLCLLSALSASGDDWPTYRHDPSRSGASPEDLPRELHLQWVKQFPPLEPAWPDQPRLRFDVAYEPIVAAGTLFLASPASDSVTALDAATGAERWRFYADGPVRFAPTAWRGMLYFACDDGHLYCLDAASGTLRWRFRGGPSDRTALGNGRLVSVWTARGAPVVHEGRVYFAAGIWPFEGVFVHALDAETGQVAWTNDGAGSIYINQPHYSPAFAGLAPQGYLAVAGDKLLVPCGRSVPAALDLATGKLLYYELAWNQRIGGFLVAANRAYFANGGALFDLENGDRLGDVGPAPVMTDEVAYGSEQGELCAFDLRGRERSADDDYASRRYYYRRWRPPKLWRLRTRGPAFIKAGSRLYAGAKNAVQAIDIPAPGRKPQVSWEAPLAGTPATMAAANQRLYVATLEGHLYCFGPTRTAARLPATSDDVLVPTNALWRYLDEPAPVGNAWRTAAFDDSRWAFGPPSVEDDEGEGEGEGADGEPASAARKPRRRPATIYFRHTFRAPAAARYAALKLELQATDGAVVYLNGTEVWRKRVPDAFGYWTMLSDRAPEGAVEKLEVDPALLTQGANNVLAVELVAAAYSTTTPHFELELVGTRGDALPAPTRRPRPETPFVQAADDILKRAGASAGYCVMLGVGTGGLAEELARRSRLHITAIEPEAERAAAARRRLDDAGLLGSRVAVRVADPLALPLPPYVASLVVSEDLAAAGFGDAGRSVEAKRFVERAFGVLRPYGGVACLALSEDEHAALTRSVLEAALPNAQVERSGGLSLLRRAGALPGAGEWTHQYGDAANTVASRDTLVKLPLGILWWGGSSNERVLPRHGHGPAPHVLGGRLIIEGPDGLRATDIYTGRVLWEATLPGLGEAYDNTEHQPGANALGSNYASAPDGIYVAYGKTCLRLDPATGERLAEFTLPLLGGASVPAWGFIALWDDVLVAGTSPADFDTDPEFTPDEFRATDYEERDELIRWLASIKGFTPRPKTRRETDAEMIARNLNRLLADAALGAKLPKAPSSKARALESAIRAHLKHRSQPATADRELKRLNRLLLEEHCPLLPAKRVLAGKPSIYSGTASEWLVAMNRYSGRVLWTRQARDGFLHNGIAIGRDKLFALDRVPEGIVRGWRWRGMTTSAPKFQLIALDVRSGSLLWSNTRDVFGAWLSYSQDHDILFQGWRASRDMLPEPGDRMMALQGESGQVLWDIARRYDGPCMLLGETLLTQGAAFDLWTGQPRLRPHPLTGEDIPWTFARNYGCGTAIACPNLLAFRSAAAGYYDLERDAGTGNLGGFRSGCTSNLIPAGGLLNAPDYTRTCTCSYQNQTSLALVHTPGVETWTFNHLKRSDAPIRRVGINLGAPGDRLADDGTLWLDYPAVGGPSPHVPVHTDPEAPEWFTHHSSWVLPIPDSKYQIPDSNPQPAIRSPQPAIHNPQSAIHNPQSLIGNPQSAIGSRQSPIPWVAASGAKGIRSVAITLGTKLTRWRREHPTLLSRWLGRAKLPKLPPRTYTVRLHFVEPDAARPGERVFAVALQGQTVIEALDVTAEAGGPRRPLVKEFRGIEVSDDLIVELTPAANASRPETVLCGVELVAED